jgi:predicted  nucleic acid-binding Zn ribbon protein
MHIAEIRIARKRRPCDGSEHSDAILYLILALRRNGQVIDRDHTVAQVRGGYLANVSVPEAQALRPSLHNARVREAMRALPKAGLGLPRVRVVGHEPDSAPVCRCRKRSLMLLETDLLSVEPPLRCGDCRGVIPLYRLPYITKGRTYECILSWAYYYRLFDGMWIGSGVGEQLAYRELSRHDSDLSRHGREICASLGKHTGTPTYYALMKYYGRSQASERKRKCPNCGRKWLLDARWLDRFEFRCDRCCLVSEIASDVVTQWT